MNKRILSTLIASIGFIIMILDAKTALRSAAEGIDLCIRTVIPSLFPFLFLSIMLTNTISGYRLPFIKKLGLFTHIPDGSETLLLVGLLGGYPVGAQSIAEAVRNRNISRETGSRMLSFCSNAGPAFLFGIGSTLFSQPWKCWVIWAIHILSALLIGHYTPCTTVDTASVNKPKPVSFSQAMQQALRVMATICGWVVIFCVIRTFCLRWFLWRLPSLVQCIFAGILELSNGCCSLLSIDNEDLRFLLFSLFLGFGGICVTMQTYSVCNGVNTSHYLPGKVMHAILSTLIASAVISREMTLLLLLLSVISVTIQKLFVTNRKKQIAFLSSVMYNGKKANRR